MAVENSAPDVAASSIVSQVISTWRDAPCHSTPDALSVLQQYPQLHQYDSLIMDLAYEEYCLRRESGENVPLSTFCERFPTVADSLRILLAAHECIEEDGGALTPQVAWPEAPSRFLGFDLIRELGRGTFARVFLATEPALGDRLVVVKISPRGQGEAETLGRMSHRNIVPVYSIQEDATTLLSAICMPYLGRGTLFDVTSTVAGKDCASLRASLLIAAGRQSTDSATVPREFVDADPVLEKVSYVAGITHIAAQLADALAYAHDAGICHRDLKPSNILLAPSGRPLLLDFNLSSDNRLAQTLVGGTLPYMPPEQLQGVADFQCEEPVTGDPRSDIFSLGVILYELLAGKLPFGDQTPHEAAGINAMRILARQADGCEDLTSLVSDMPPALARIVRQCLQWDPQERPATARALAAQLRACLTPRARLAVWARRRAFLLASATAGLGILGAAVGTRLALRPPLAQRRYYAGVQAFQNGELETALQHLDAAVNADPAAYEPRYVRGQLMVQLGLFEEAIKDLQFAYHEAPQERIAAWSGYACQCLYPNDTAEYFYEKAIQAHQTQLACVYNNLGENLFRRGLYVRAVEPLTRAIQLDPQCQVAYINRALASSNAQSHVDDPTPYLEQALADIELATTFPTRQAQAHFWAGCVNMAHNTTPAKDDIVLDHFRAALEFGLDWKRLQQGCGIPEYYTQPLLNYRPQVQPVDFAPLRLSPPREFPPMMPR